MMGAFPDIDPRLKPAAAVPRWTEGTAGEEASNGNRLVVKRPCHRTRGTEEGRKNESHQGAREIVRDVLRRAGRRWTEENRWG